MNCRQGLYTICTILTAVSVSGMLTGGCAFAAEAPEAQEVQEIRTFGEENASSAKFEFVNGTDTDITWLHISVNDGRDQAEESVRIMQEALIEQGYLDDVVDGNIGPKTQAAMILFRAEHGLSEEAVMDEDMLDLLNAGNILGSEDVIEPGVTAVVFFEDSGGETQDQGNVFMVYKEYIATFRLAGDDTEYILHTLPVDETTITIRMENGIPYVEYRVPGTDQVISTLENEKTFYRSIAESEES